MYSFSKIRNLIYSIILLFQLRFGSVSLICAFCVDGSCISVGVFWCWWTGFQISIVYCGRAGGIVEPAPQFLFGLDEERREVACW